MTDESKDPQDRPSEPTEPSARMLSWVKNSALYRLNQKMMTEHELFAALRKKALTKFEGMTPELATRIARFGIDFCNEHRLLDDKTYAEMKTASAARSGHSRRRIARDLKTKGVEAELIEASLDGVDDLASALNYARRRAFGPYRKVPLDDKRKLKEFGAFARNGYSSGIAGKVINLSLDELEALLEETAGS